MMYEALIAKGKKQGFVTHEDVIAVFPDPDNHLTEIDTLYISLHEMGIEVVGSIPQPPEDSGPEPESQPWDSADLPIHDLSVLYLQEIGQIPLLTPEREIELAKLVRQGTRAAGRLSEHDLSETDRIRYQTQKEQGEQAARALVEANLRLVASIAWRYRNKGLPLLDLIQEGNIGLMKAAERFDSRLGYRFSTYATWWIRQSITRSIADQGRTIRLPVHVHESLARAEQAARQLGADLGKRPTRSQLAVACGMTEASLTRLLDRLPRMRSLDALVCCSNFSLVSSDAGSMLVQQTPCPARRFAELYWQRATWNDDFEMPPCLLSQGQANGNHCSEQIDYQLMSFAHEMTSPQEPAANNALREAINETLEGLSARQSAVLELRFGLKDGHEYTLEEIGQKYGLTRERIRQIQAQAIDRLKHPVRSRKLKPFLD